MISNDSLSECLSDGIDLRSKTRTSNSDSNVKIGESLSTKKKNGLVDLSLKELRVDKINRRTINLKESFSRSDGGNCDGVFLSAEGLYQLGFLLLSAHFFDFYNFFFED